MVYNVSLNKIEITWNIHEGLYFLVSKSQQKWLTTSMVSIFCLTLINTKLTQSGYFYSDGIRSSLFVLLGIAQFFLIL